MGVCEGAGGCVWMAALNEIHSIMTCWWVSPSTAVSYLSEEMQHRSTTGVDCKKEKMEQTDHELLDGRTLAVVQRRALAGLDDLHVIETSAGSPNSVIQTCTPVSKSHEDNPFSANTQLNWQ